MHLQLSTNIVDEMRAKFALKPMCAASLKSGARSPLPMWKLTDMPVSRAAAHTESQCEEQSGGWPQDCGWPHASSALYPLPAQRSISRTHWPTSQNTPAITGTSRRRSALHHSTRKSL